MKKIININFHSRVVPIEETAYEILQQYIDSLRKYFANEEGRDEIISDIENRFSELFAENLKKGATCITDADVNTIITSMGRPEDFEEEEGKPAAGAATGNIGTASGSNASAGYAGSGSQPTGSSQQSGSYQYGAAGTGTGTTEEPRRLYRADNDKILGGVCAGLANYLRLDPAIIRIIFVLITFGWGAGFLIYIILWAVLPTKSLPQNVRKRLYRNSDDRVIGGVSSGLAAYFHIEVWIPRLIFILPLIAGIITPILRSAWFDFDGPAFFTGGFGGTLFITYIVLWIVLPEAVTASEKLEMRGEKVDLESIKNTIKSDLEGFKGRAREMGAEMQERFQQVGQQVKQSTQNFTSEAGPAIRRTRGGLGHAVGVLFKAFFLFIAGIIAFALIMLLIGLAFRGDGVLSLKNYILEGFAQNFLAWSAFILFLVVPVIALLTWLIRRITGVRSRNHYLGYTFGTLWIIGLFCFIALVAMTLRNFRSRAHVEEDIVLSQPTYNKLVINAVDGKSNFYDEDWWFDNDWRNNGLFFSLNEDSVTLKTIRVSLRKSTDSDYHVQVIKFSRGKSSYTAKETAGEVIFNVRQADSVLYLPHGFTISRNQKFRNQQVLVTVSIPVGKHIYVNKNVENYEWFSINVNNSHISWDNHGDGNWNQEDNDRDPGNSYYWTGNTDYIMTPTGLVRTDKKIKDLPGKQHDERDDKEDDDENPGYKSSDKRTDKPADRPADKPATENGGYRYHRPAGTPKPKADTNVNIRGTAMHETSVGSPVYLLSALFSQ